MLKACTRKGRRVDLVGDRYYLALERDSTGLDSVSFPRASPQEPPELEFATSAPLPIPPAPRPLFPSQTQIGPHVLTEGWGGPPGRCRPPAAVPHKLGRGSATLTVEGMQEKVEMPRSVPRNFYAVLWLDSAFPWLHLATVLYLKIGCLFATKLN